MMVQVVRNPDDITIECLGLSDDDVQDLQSWLAATERVRIRRPHLPLRRKNPDVRYHYQLLTLVDPVSKFIAQYMGTKALDFIAKEIKRWMRERSRTPDLITLNLNGIERMIKPVGARKKAASKKRTKSRR